MANGHCKQPPQRVDKNGGPSISESENESASMHSRATSYAGECIQLDPDLMPNGQHSGSESGSQTDR